MAGSRRRFTATTSRCRQPPSLWRARSSVRTTKSWRSEEHTSELQSQSNLVCRLLLEKKKKDQRDDGLDHISDNNQASAPSFPPSQTIPSISAFWLLISVSSWCQLASAAILPLCRDCI